MDSSKSFDERRKHPRVDYNLPVKISCEEADFVTETRNFSRTGAYCRVNKFVAPMTKLKIHLLLPLKRNGKTVTKKISCQGIVIRMEPIAGQDYYHAAIYFNDIKQKDADYISDYVQDEIKKDKSKNPPDSIRI